MAVRRHMYCIRWLYIVLHKKILFGFGFGFLHGLLSSSSLIVALTLSRLRPATRTGISVACLRIWVWLERFQPALALVLVWWVPDFWVFQPSSWALLVVVVVVVAVAVAVVVETTFDWVDWVDWFDWVDWVDWFDWVDWIDWVAWESVRRMGCSLDCRRDHGLVLHWAPISVKGSRIGIWVWTWWSWVWVRLPLQSLDVDWRKARWLAERVVDCFDCVGFSLDRSIRSCVRVGRSSDRIDSAASGNSLCLLPFSRSARCSPSLTFLHQSTPCKRVCLSCGPRLWLRVRRTWVGFGTLLLVDLIWGFTALPEKAIQFFFKSWKS